MCGFHEKNCIRGCLGHVDRNAYALAYAMHLSPKCLHQLPKPKVLLMPDSHDTTLTRQMEGGFGRCSISHSHETNNMIKVVNLLMPVMRIKILVTQIIISKSSKIIVIITTSKITIAVQKPEPETKHLWVCSKSANCTAGPTELDIFLGSNRVYQKCSQCFSCFHPLYQTYPLVSPCSYGKWSSIDDLPLHEWCSIAKCQMTNRAIPTTIRNITTFRY